MMILTGGGVEVLLLVPGLVATAIYRHSDFWALFGAFGFPNEAGEPS